MKLFKLSMIFILAQLCSISFAANIKTTENPEVQISGETTWKIGGTEYLINGTMIVSVPTYPHNLYAIRVIINEDPSPKLEPLAKSIAKYAYENGYYDQLKQIKINNKQIELLPKIGIALIRQANYLFVTDNKGYRFQFDIKDL